MAESGHELAVKRLVLPVWLLVSLGLAFNQTSVVFGVNLSFADLIALLALAALFLAGQLWIPGRALGFFLVLSLTTLVAAVLVTPILVPIRVQYDQVLVNWLKLVISFCYLVLGANIARSGEFWKVLRAFVLGAVVIGLLAVVGMVVQVSAFLPGLYYGGFRFRGLMNDPNYFSVIQVAALAILWRDVGVARRYRLLGALVLFVSVLLSGSKTGAIVFAVWLVWRILTSLLGDRDVGSATPRIIGFLLRVAAAILLLIVTIDSSVLTRLAATWESVPALLRVNTLLVNFQAAFVQDGSGRGDTWSTALEMLKVSPLTGVGVGVYQEVSRTLTGVATLAHNTFLQIGAEWGLVLSAVFFGWVLVLLLRKPKDSALWARWRTGRDALIVMLVGSLGLSLNNAMLFWFILGMTVGTAIWTPAAQADRKDRTMKSEPMDSPTARSTGALS